MLIQVLFPRFLLAGLQIDRICVARTVKKIKSTLISMPRELDDLYRETVERIRRQSGDDGELGMRVLSWVTHTKRPLHVEELAHGLAVEYDDDEGAHDLDTDNLLSSRSLVDVCAGLVVIDPRSQIIRLVHYTAQEYFDKERLKLFNNAEVDISTASLTYLSYDIAKTTPSDKIISEAVLSHPFLTYASLFWFLHVEEIGENAWSHSVKQISMEYINDPAKIMFSAVVLRKMLLPPRIYVRVFEDIRRERRGNLIALEAASECGLLQLVRFILDHSVGSESAMDNAVNWASAEGHTGVVTLLIERGASVQSLTEDSSNALHKACKGGHLGVAKILLQHGANVNTSDRWMWTPLHHAARGGSGLVALLLAHNANPNSQTPLGLTACHLAASSGNAETVTLLLDAGYDLGLTTRDKSTPLHKAAEWRHLEVCRLLLQRGSDVQAKTSYGQTALELIKDSATPEVMGIFEPYIYAARGTENRRERRPTEREFEDEEITLLEKDLLEKERWWWRWESHHQEAAINERGRMSDEISDMSVWQETASTKQSFSHEDYGAFFTPVELVSQSSDHVKITSANADADIDLEHVPQNVTVEPNRVQDLSTVSDSPAFPPMDTDDRTDTSTLSFTWQVPRIRLITPTPPLTRKSTTVL